MAGEAGKGTLLSEVIARRAPESKKEIGRRIADEPGLDRVGTQWLQQWRRRDEFLLNRVAHVLEHAPGLHNRARIALLAADAQRRLRPRRVGECDQQDRTMGMDVLSMPVQIS